MASPIRWVTVVLDRAAADVEATERFLRATTGWTPDERTDPYPQFAMLQPADADAVVCVQRTDDDSTGAHVDLYVDDLDAMAATATAAGGTVLFGSGEIGIVMLRSPAGLVHCVIGHHGQQTVPPPQQLPGGKPIALDQICIDVPEAGFEAEATYWAAVTGWPRQGSSLAEFDALARDDAVGFRVLLQRRVEGDEATVHLDWACGDAVDEAVRAHVTAGAVEVERLARWTVMADPAGARYCLTSRTPRSATGPSAV